MENKDQNNTSVTGGALQNVYPDSGVVYEPLDSNALSSAPDGEPLSTSQEQQPKGRANIFLHFVRRLDVMLAALLIIAGVTVFFAFNKNNEGDKTPTSLSNSYGTVAIPLDELIAGKNLNLTGAANVTINGPIQLNNGLRVAPTLQPTGAQPGQIYYDQNTNQLAYFNGEQFVFLTGPSEGQGNVQTLTSVQSLGGASGVLTVGDGLSVNGNQLSNSGVLSVQGQNGDVTFTAGPGIVLNGTGISNSGILSVASGSPNVTVANDGNGNVTVSVTSGAGTITSSGGTAGRVPLFTASQNIEDSIIMQSGLTVTITGDLSVVTGGLTLSNALTVSNGGTGASSLANNGVLVGNGTAAVSAVAAGGAGLCLLSTAGAPTWGACPGGAGVTTLNGLSGAVNIANASAAGSTITLDDASTASKGIASFNGTNFTVSSGAVNTVQNINSGATPTFAGVNTNNITPSGPMTVGVSAQTALLQGSTTTITSNGVGNNIVLNSAATIELQDNTNVTGTITTTGDIAVNGGDITSTGALNITPGGTLTVGVSNQTLTLQGGASTSLRATSGANTTTVAFASPTANTTLNFPALAAGTYTICTTSGNCSGAAATLQSTYDNSTTPEIVLDATRGALTIRDNASALGANLLEVQNNAGSTTYLAVTAAGVAVTGTATVSGNINSTSGGLQTNGTTRIDNSGNAVNIGSVTLAGAISGGTTITSSGNINSTGGALQTNSTNRIDNTGNLVNIAAITASGNATIQGGSVTVGTGAQAGVILLNDGSSNTGTLQVAALGQDTVYTLPDPGAGTATICLTTGNCAGSGGGVTTGGGTTNRLPKFTGAQSLGDSSISDDGSNVSVSIDVIVQGGDLTLGTTSQAASMVLHDGNGQTTTLQAGNSAGNLTFILPTNTGVANQCLKQSGTGNQLVWQDCDGGSGGSSATLQTAYNNSTSPEIVLNSSVGGLTIRDNSTPLGANLFEIQNNAGSTTYLAVTVSGLSVTGTATASGNINSTGGTIQTNGTNRIDNTGNLVNIGNITGTGAVTIASIGVGNDITVDGADQFIVQDSAVFNALATFNANIDLGANDIVGTTGDINLSNFDVAGATGNVTAGTYNGQTISSSANFTGSVTVATNLTLTNGDIAVNGGDITSTGALNITPGGALTVGVSAQTALLQGSTTTITSNGAGNDIVLNSADTIELQDNTNVTGTITTTGDIAVNGGDITSTGALNITPGGTLTLGSASQALLLQGDQTTTLTATSGANTTTIAFTNPVANTTLNFPALGAGTYTICTTSGNCAGAASTLQSTYDNSTNPEIVLDATRGALTIRDNASALGANLLEVQSNTGATTYFAVTATGVSVTGTATVSGNINSTGGTIQTNGTNRIDNTGNLVNIGSITASGNATLQGGGLTLGTTSQAGTIVLNDGSSNTGTLQVAALGQDTVYTLPDPGTGTATICLTTGNCAGSGGGVTTGGGTTNRLPKFTGAQSLGDSSISDDGSNVTVDVDVIIQGGDLTIGTTSQTASIILHDGNGQTTTLQAGDSAGNLTFVLPTDAGLANQCLKQSGTGNQLVWQDCDGGSGGSSATLQTAYNNSTSPEITLDATRGALTIRDNSTPLGANLFEIQNNAGSTTYLAVTVTGVDVTGAATASGNINSTGGALQTNGTSRIDNSGNAVNIGNITGSGAITIASIGAGSDITIDGADQFIVQDSAVFNALTTFNANISLGANDIVGTTGDINLTNFDVAGATGNVTAGTYNGQTISSSANFTGSVTVATDLTLTSGDIAVNGGDITSTGALNITPGGTLTVGVAGQQLVLQGDGNTTLVANGGGFTTTVGFNGTPAANVVYNFDRAAAAGTYTICTTVGNCAGTGGGVTTLGGTTGTLPVFTGAQTLGDSLVSQSGGTVSIAGSLSLGIGDQYQINGTQISSAALSNDANLAKLSASQTFTGGTIAFQNGTNSTNAFSVQNAAGTRVLTVDTTGGQVVLGIASTLDGKLVFNNVSNANTVSFVPGAPTANRTITLPDASGVICLDSGNCAGAGATLQTSYNFSVGGTTPKIKVNSTLLGVDIQDADTTIAANLFNIRASNAVGLGSVMFGVNSTGAVTLQNAANSTAAFRLLTQGGTSVLTGDTQNGSISLGQAGTLTGSLIFQNATNSNTTTIALTTPTANRTITLPNATGTVCLDSGNCAGAGSSNTLQAAYDAGNTITTSNSRDIVFTMADTATDANFLVNLQCDTSCGSNGRFAIQDDGVDVFAVAPSGTIAFQPTVSSTTAFNMKTTLNNNIFTIDTVNSRVGINLGSNNLPTLAGTEPGLHLQGAFRISGTSGMDTYTTPVGASVAAKINIENQSSLSNYGQVMAMGLTAGSSATVRVLSLFDARTTRHQPTIAVFSPDENTSIGFSWNGSNATASVQTSDSDSSNTKNIIVQSGNVTVGSNANSGDLQLNTGTIAGTGSKTGDIYLVSGDGAGTNNSTGNVSVDVGVNTGSGTRGTLNIGVTNANTLLIGRAAGATTLQGGTTTVSGTLAANGDVTLGNALADLITVGGTIQGGSPFVFEGATADANELTLAIASLTADRTITLPDATGTVCLQSSSSCGFVTGTTADYIQNQNASDQTANFRINGTGRAATALQSPLFDTPTAVALAIGTTNATAINLNQNTTIAAGKTLTVTSAATSLTGATTGDALTVSNSTSTGNIAVFKDNSSAVFTIGDGGLFTAKTTASTSSAFVIQNGSSATLFSTDTFNNTVKLVTIGRDNTSTYEAIWLQGSKNGITSLIGGNDDTSTYVANDFSGSLRFNGSGVGWGDLAYFPNGGGNGNNGQFRFSTTGSALNTTPNAKVGVGDLYVNGAIGVATNSPSYSLGFGAGANRTIGIQAQTASNTAGNTLTVSAGAGNGTGAGGGLTLQAGAGNTLTTGSAGGTVTIAGGNAGGSGNNNGGNVLLQAGSYTGTGTAGVVRVKNLSDGQAFVVQNAAGTRNFISVDTSDLTVDLGTTGTEASSSTVQIANSTAQDQYVYIGSSASTSETVISAGTGDLLLQSNSSVVVKSLTDGADAFNVTDSVGGSILSVNTSNNTVSTDGLQVNGTFAGAGLTDCDASNSKLLYDATTKQFSCGTDRASVAIRKSADEQVTSSITVQDDNDFFFTVGANETWAFQMFFEVNSSTTADFRARVDAPTGSTCRVAYDNVYNFTNTYTSSCGVGGENINEQGATFDNSYITYGTVVTGGTAGTVKFRWAQGTSSAGATIVRGGGQMIAYKISGADLAEAYYTKDNTIAPGDIVRIDGGLTAGVQKSQGTYDAQAIGVVSTQPGHILGDPNAINTEGRPVLLALSGRIPVKVSLENGPIKPGDYLTTSSTPGVAMKATRPGQMIGKALEGFSSGNPGAMGTVMTFANLTWADPATGTQANTAMQNSTFGDLNITGTLKTGDLTVTGKATVGELVVGTMKAESVTVTGNAYFGGDINLQGVGKSRNAITKKFIASKHIPIGSVVIIDPVNDGQVTTTTVMGDTRVLGVALTEAEAGGELTVAIGGSVQVKTTGAALQGGDLLVTSSQEGAVEKSVTPTPGQMMGKALGKNESDGMVWVLISLN